MQLGGVPLALFNQVILLPIVQRQATEETIPVEAWLFSTGFSVGSLDIVVQFHGEPHICKFKLYNNHLKIS